MFSTSLRRKTALLLFVAFFAMPWASVAGSREATAPEPVSLFGRLWSTLTRVWNETGCYIDPSGRCATATSDDPQPTPQGDEGCYIDPSGRCAS